LITRGRLRPWRHGSGHRGNGRPRPSIPVEQRSIHGSVGCRRPRHPLPVRSPCHRCGLPSVPATPGFRDARPADERCNGAHGPAFGTVLPVWEAITEGSLTSPLQPSACSESVSPSSMVPSASHTRQPARLFTPIGASRPSSTRQRGARSPTRRQAPASRSTPRRRFPCARTSGAPNPSSLGRDSAAGANPPTRRRQQ